MASSAYQQAYKQLGSAYDPQVKSVNSQIAQLQPLQNAQQAGLDQAKVNAFRDITNVANQRGMLFSGFSPDQQAQYVGTKYLPAVADLKQSFLNQRTTLLDKINAINAQRANQAQSSVAAQQQAASENAYRQAQLQLGYARLNQSAARSSQPKAPTAAQSRSADVNALYNKLGHFAGGDGYISPATYAQGLRLWQSAGYTAKQYDEAFSSLRNPNNSHYRLASGWGS